MLESDSAFCEPLPVWLLRRHVAHRQFARNHHDTSTPGGTFFQNNWEPEFHCLLSERLGQMGDGGKWVCDPLMLLREPCLIYSFGSNNNFGFEDAIQERFPFCEIHIFDHTSRPPPANSSHFFHAIGLAPLNKPPKLMSLPSIMAMLNHTGRQIDVFKIDCEGCEFGTFKSLAQNHSAILRQLRQILVEIHLTFGRTSAEAHEIFEGLHHHGFSIVNKEPNTVMDSAGNSIEYGFLRMAPQFFTAPGR